MPEPDYWYTDSQGRRRPGTRPKGRGGGVLVALIAALAIGSGGIAGVSTSGGAGTGGSAGRAGSARNAQARHQDSVAARLRLEARRLRVDQPRFEVAFECETHSYGQVREFFREQPCAALYRGSFEVRDRRGGLVLVAIAWVEMPDAASARAYHELVDTHGTGNVTELTREQGRHQDVRFTGRYYGSRREGASVVNAQAEPVGRAAVAAELEQIAADALG